MNRHFCMLAEDLIPVSPSIRVGSVRRFRSLSVNHYSANKRKPTAVPYPPQRRSDEPRISAHEEAAAFRGRFFMVGNPWFILSPLRRGQMYPHQSSALWAAADSCLAAAHSAREGPVPGRVRTLVRRGSDMPPACLSLPRPCFAAPGEAREAIVPAPVRRRAP